MAVAALKTSPVISVAEGLIKAGGASSIVGGQWGSEAKGTAAAWLAYELAKQGRFFDIVTTNAGAQAGHTSTHKGQKRIVYHLPTAPLITHAEGLVGGAVYLNAGSIIDPEGLEKELNTTSFGGPLYIHPMAAVITDECREAELDPDSSHTRIASTRKGVGQALAHKVTRAGLVARDHKFLSRFVRRMDLNQYLLAGKSILIEVPQGVSLSLNHSTFYPYCTSRDCIPSSAVADAGIHPSFYYQTMMVIRTYPIRVGHIVDKGEEIGNSGPHYPDQEETTWESIGVEAEITTVTKRVRRVFTFSQLQLEESMRLCRPDVVFLSFCNYVKNPAIVERIVSWVFEAATTIGLETCVVKQHGPTTEDVDG